MKFIFSFLVFTLSISSSFAQAGGARAYAGLTTISNKDNIANPEGHAHTGYHIGIDARIMSGGMSFLLGGRYTSVSKVAIEEFKLSGHPSSLSLLNGRVGLDFSIISFGPLFRLRSKVLGSFDMVIAESGSEMPPPGYNLNDGWLGAVTGLGADIGPFIIDLEYEFGVINAYNKVKGSTFDSFTVSVGFFF